MSVVGIVLAAGAGRRAGLGRNKVLVDVGGRSVLERSVRTIADVVDAVVVVVRPRDRDEVAVAVGDLVAAVVSGGATRHDSEAAGLAAAEALGATTVAIHDAARPLVPVEVVRAVVDAALGGVAVVPALPRPAPLALWPDPDETVRDVGSLVDRSAIVGVQTPQAAPASLLRSCFDAVAGGEADAQLDTVEPVLRHRPDVDVVVVEGSPRNVKVTWHNDLDRAVRLLEQTGDVGTDTGLHLRPGRPTGGGAPVGIEVDGVTPVTDALRAVADDRIVAAVDRTRLVDVVGDVLAAPGVLGDDLDDLGVAIERAVADGAGLRLRRRR